MNLDMYKIREQVNFEAVYLSASNAATTTSATPTQVSTAGTLYTYRTSAATISFASSSASDTTVTVTVEGLDANYLPISETVTLTGTSAALTTNSYLRINGAYLSGVAVGTVTGTVSGGTNIVIPIGDTRYHAVVYTVPALSVAYVVAVRASTDTGKYAQFIARFRRFGRGWFNFYEDETTAANGRVDHTFAAPHMLPGKTDIDMQVVNTSATCRVHGGIELWVGA